METPDTAADMPLPVARFAGAFGYRIEADTASLNADIDWTPAAADHVGWRLQLWARPLDTPGPALLLAELALQVPLHTHGEPLPADGHVMAVPPAGGGPHEMTLRLVSTGADGRPLLHDSAAFGQPERFVQPRLQGANLRPGGADGLALWVERVHNPRPADNLSGSLMLELWALEAPFDGGPFVGRVITTMQLEALAGQGGTGPLVMPVPGTAADRQRPWCLMLREWTAAGYVTRDHVGLTPPLPARSPAPAAVPVPAPARAPAAMAIELPPARPVPVSKPATDAHEAVPAGLGARLMANLRHLLQR